MEQARARRVVRFGVFEADVGSGELRKRGVRLHIQEQPFQILATLIERPGELVTRDELRQRLWPADTFVDFDRGLNTAINKLREALDDSAGNPRFIETLPKRGYRFIAPVAFADATQASPSSSAGVPAAAASGAMQPEAAPAAGELPRPNRTLVRGLFAAAQVMYLCFYLAALANLEPMQERVASLTGAGIWATYTLAVTAAAGIPLRLFLLTTVLFDYRRSGAKFERLFPLVLVLDVLWALSPFLLAHRIGAGLALAICAALVYLPFGQRTLARMAYGESVG